MFEQFTDKSRKLIVVANEEQLQRQNDFLETKHLVLAMLRESDSFALKRMGFPPSRSNLKLSKTCLTAGLP